MTVDIEPGKLDVFLKIEKEMSKIIDKYSEGPLPGRGMIDAKDYAYLQVIFYFESRDLNEMLQWTHALEAAHRSPNQNSDVLKEKLKSSGREFIDCAEGHLESVRHGEALLNLAKSI
jgi:hypothetical protein